MLQAGDCHKEIATCIPGSSLYCSGFSWKKSHEQQVKYIKGIKVVEGRIISIISNHPCLCHFCLSPRICCDHCATVLQSVEAPWPAVGTWSSQSQAGIPWKIISSKNTPYKMKYSHRIHVWHNSPVPTFGWCFLLVNNIGKYTCHGSYGFWYITSKKRTGGPSLSLPYPQSLLSMQQCFCSGQVRRGKRDEWGASNDRCNDDGLKALKSIQTAFSHQILRDTIILFVWPFNKYLLCADMQKPKTQKSYVHHIFEVILL